MGTLGLPDHRLLCHKLNSLAEETDDSVTRMTARLAALTIKTLADELAVMQGRKEAPKADMAELANHVYRAGETLYMFNLLDGDHLRFEHLHRASAILRALPSNAK